MAEQINLTTPDQTSGGTTHYWINGIDLNKENPRATFHLGSTGGFRKTLTIVGDDALAYIRALNRRNATVTSNERWTLSQLISKGYLNGTISGTPD